MLELKTKWFTNSLAKESILKRDFVACDNGTRLYIVGYGALTSSGKNTYNYELKDAKGVLLANGENTYLDKLTTIVKGENPKSKERKEKSESKPKAKASKPQKNENNESLLLTFDEAFNEACKQIEAYKSVAIELDKYNTRDAINLAMIILQDAKIKEEQRLQDAKKNANIEALKRTLAIAIESKNDIMIEQIKQMILIEESM